MARAEVKARAKPKVKRKTSNRVKAGSERNKTSGGIFTSKVIAIVKKNG